MIPINLQSSARERRSAWARDSRRARAAFLLGATYGGAMALVYGLLGLIVILTAGTFGTINSSPGQRGIARSSCVLGLAMFDVIVIDFPAMGAGLRRAVAAARSSWRS